jgi:hypothetical protein
MKLDLNNPASIVAWSKVRPEVHAAQLETFAAMWPQFRRTIAMALVLIECEHEQVADAAEEALV